MSKQHGRRPEEKKKLFPLSFSNDYLEKINALFAFRVNSKSLFGLLGKEWGEVFCVFRRGIVVSGLFLYMRRMLVQSGGRLVAVCFSFACFFRLMLS